jgi:hypothetical protein
VFGRELSLVYPHRRLETIYIRMRWARNGPPVPYAGTGVPPRLDPTIGAGRWSALLSIVIDHTQSETHSSFQPAYAMPHADPVESAAALHGPMARRENESLSLPGDNDFSFGLGARLLFHNHEFATFIVDARPAQKAGQLQWEGDGAVHVLVETVEIAAFIVQQQRRCSSLSITRAGIEKTGMTLGKNVGQTESLIPLIGERDELRIAVLPQMLDDGGQRIVKVFVIAAAKAVAGHDDVAPECVLRAVQVHEVCTFGGCEEGGSQSVTVLPH